jgi:hypothetical protein
LNLYRAVCTTIVLTVGIGHAAPSAAEAAPKYFFCQSAVTESRMLYLTDVFSSTAQAEEVTNAWRKSLAAIVSTDPRVGATGTCEGGTRETIESQQRRIADAMVQNKVSLVHTQWSYAVAPTHAKSAAPRAGAPPPTPVQH